MLRISNLIFLTFEGLLPIFSMHLLKRSFFFFCAIYIFEEPRYREKLNIRIFFQLKYFIIKVILIGMYDLLYKDLT